jgi:RNA 2',3'-cyclic 3'-phosphodiesterase
LVIEQTSTPTKRRLFFALWPDDSLRERLGETVLPTLDGRRARKVRLANLHITLAFLGAVRENDVQNVIAAADRVIAEPFDLTLDRLESWRAAHVACLVIAPVPAPLAVLVDRLRFNLLARNVDVDQKEFRAHLTVARDWRDTRLAERVGPFVWSVREFVLVESKPSRAGAEYRMLERWPLR